MAQEAAAPSAFMDLSWMHVKQDKVAEFSQLMARTADANRRGKGDNWIAYMDMYGRDNYVWIAAARPTLGDIEPAMMKFSGAVKEFMGYSLDRFFVEASKTVDSSGSELWRHRFDLSWNIKDSADWQQQLAKAHYVVVVTIRVKTGHMLDAEKQIKTVSDAVAASQASTAGLVSQVFMGGDPQRFYVRIPMESLAGLDQMPSLRKVLSEEAYRAYAETSEKAYASLDYTLKRIVPEWSAPPAAFVAANPGMWKMKPMAPKSKPAATEPKAATTGGE